MSALGLLSAEALAELVALVADEVERRAEAATVTRRREIGAWLSIAEAAALFGVDHKTLRRAIAEARLPAVRIGRALRVREADVAEHLAYRAGGSTVAPGRRQRAKSKGTLSAIARETSNGGV